MASFATGGVVYSAGVALGTVDGEPAELDLWDLDLGNRSHVAAHARQVARAGGDKTECPLAPSDSLWSAWQRAWNDTRSGIEEASGAMRYRTDLMKAEVRRQTEHLPQCQPDPCAEVIEQPGFTVHLDGQPFTIKSWQLNAISVRMEPIVAAAKAAEEEFCKAAQALVDVFNAAAPTIADLAGIIEQAAPERVTSEQRRRHGAAALCPRHGPTRGGTCMRCRR